MRERKNRMVADTRRGEDARRPESASFDMTASTSVPPQDDLGLRIAALCRHIDASVEADPDAPLTLEALAQRAGISRFHLQRRFKAITGLSPRQYVEAARLRRFKQGLRGADSVTGAIHDAGYGSSSRAYERSAAHLGMTPGQYRAQGQGVALSWAYEDSALGPLLMAASDRGLCFVQFGESRETLLAQLGEEFPQAAITPMPPESAGAFRAWMDALADHLAGGRDRHDLPLDLRGTAFQHQVWTYLLSIPPGELRSYAEVAAGIGKPRAVRAVASACAANRVGVFVPCHRVIRGDGSLGGYRWGLARKRALIDAERGRRPD